MNGVTRNFGEKKYLEGSSLGPLWRQMDGFVGSPKGSRSRSSSQVPSPPLTPKKPNEWVKSALVGDDNNCWGRVLLVDLRQLPCFYLTSTYLETRGFLGTMRPISVWLCHFLLLSPTPV